MEHRKDATLSYFECYRHFEPIDDLIEICLYGNIGPTEKQILFFKKIEKHYDNVLNVIAPAIAQEIRNWKADFRIVSFKDEFTPIFLVIPHCKEGEVNWEISFSKRTDLNHVFNVRLKNFEIVEIDVDG